MNQRPMSLRRYPVALSRGATIRPQYHYSTNSNREERKYSTSQRCLFTTAGSPSAVSGQRSAVSGRPTHLPTYCLCGIVTSDTQLNGGERYEILHILRKSNTPRMLGGSTSFLFRLFLLLNMDGSLAAGYRRFLE